MKRIPRGLAYDMLFGQNKGDAHEVLDAIYDSVGSCNECESMDYEVGAALGECVRFGCLKMPDGYCDEFIEITRETK